MARLGSVGRAVLSAGLAGALGGCMPVVAHGPEVHPGISEGISIGAGVKWPTRAINAARWDSAGRSYADPWDSAPTFYLEPALRYGSRRAGRRQLAVQGALSVRIPAALFSEAQVMAPAGDVYVQDGLRWYDRTPRASDGPRLVISGGFLLELFDR